MYIAVMNSAGQVFAYFEIQGDSSFTFYNYVTQAKVSGYLIRTTTPSGRMATHAKTQEIGTIAYLYSFRDGMREGDEVEMELVGGGPGVRGKASSVPPVPTVPTANADSSAPANTPTAANPTSGSGDPFGDELAPLPPDTAKPVAVFEIQTGPDPHPVLVILQDAVDPKRLYYRYVSPVSPQSGSMRYVEATKSWFLKCNMTNFGEIEGLDPDLTNSANLYLRAARGGRFPLTRPVPVPNRPLTPVKLEEKPAPEVRPSDQSLRPFIRTSVAVAARRSISRYDIVRSV